MEDKKTLLTKAECDALRGIAILGIMLHNFCHLLKFAIKENEYKFYMERSQQLADYVAGAMDEMFFVQLMSYFGHYGVPIFVFLSGYGLTLKYEQASKGAEPTVWNFTRCHYLKLLRMMVPGFVAFVIVDFMTIGPYRYPAENVIALFGMVANLLPEPNNVIWPGPYWFFGLMMQLYIIYRVVLFRRHWGYIVALIAVCWLLQECCVPDGDALNYLRYNFVGGMLPFGAGMLAARFLYLSPSGASRWHWLFRCVLLSIAVVAGCFSFQTWLWVPIAVIFAAVCLVKSLPRMLLEKMVWFGSISAAMFVIHPVARKIFIPISRRGDVYDGLLLYFISAVALAWLTKLVIDKIANPSMNKKG